ncbi:hypothetical protein AVEN_132276-1 [Araneus ventricosus]|uniref:Uncharacterized protein n=1 Tax=Araneus ventricosus TaxID=182803 RepID=A0A4Y2JR66_ARAVE|nr:hypothetical protein AVEN_132276-1 [Araneus ventricosus]
MNWTLPTWVVIYPSTLPLPSLKAHGKGLWLARIIGLPPRLSPKRSQNLPSKGANRLRSAFVHVKGKFLDRLARCERVKINVRRTCRLRRYTPRMFLFMQRGLKSI